MGSRAAAPKGSMTYAFTQGDFLLLLLLLLLLHPPYPNLQAHISAWRLGGGGCGGGGGGGGGGEGENSPYV